MKLRLMMAALGIALLAPSVALGAHYVQHKPFRAMTPTQKEQWLVRQATHDRGAIRWYSNHLVQPFPERYVLSVTPFPQLLRTRRWHRELRWYRSSLRVASKHLRAVREEIAAQARTTIPFTGDWLTAVQLVQRAYGGSAWWLIACSSSEGGHGGFVMNTRGSGAGGWMQYMSGTFDGDWAGATADLRARGFRYPAEAGSWSSPLGQAIAAGWAYSHNRPAGKWTGARC